jgi:hypothetical protein
MIKEKGLVVPLKDMFTHPPILLQNDITMSRKDIPRSRAARNVLIHERNTYQVALISSEAS